ncbi:type IV pilus modification PilV family protein [Campylobacter geochelonis]|uniref:Periplasmic protein n=1 Tax=Campylobacter geochelonis TaxID=1780362 RepID=A0A128EDW8_9BACT|nr:hypothetical protein [Campylobacter geochelonis]QKF71007.1 hypothetical protein CGEO_0686 [Campylobacter geochelonis]CZE47145.1 periplasmic protein [Campylobacter geochelonis]
MKRAFTLIMAMFFIVILATLGMLALSLSTQTAKQSTDIYLREQAELLARSATEFAVMAMQAHSYTPARSNGEHCLETVDITYPTADNPLFKGRVQIYYLNPLLGCRAARTIGDRNLTAATTTSITDNIAMLDVTIQSTEEAGSEPIRYFRRTIQRP